MPKKRGFRLVESLKNFSLNSSITGRCPALLWQCADRGAAKRVGEQGPAVVSAGLKKIRIESTSECPSALIIRGQIAGRESGVESFLVAT